MHPEGVKAALHVRISHTHKHTHTHTHTPREYTEAISRGNAVAANVLNSACLP